MPPEAIDLASRLLQYSPSLRCTAVSSIMLLSWYVYAIMYGLTKSLINDLCPCCQKFLFGILCWNMFNVGGYVLDFSKLGYKAFLVFFLCNAHHSGQFHTYYWQLKFLVSKFLFQHIVLSYDLVIFVCGSSIWVRLFLVLAARSMYTSFLWRTPWVQCPTTKWPPISSAL